MRLSWPGPSPSRTADALVLEGQNPTVLAVRTRLGGGSPNTITPLLAEWRALNETRQAQAMPPPPQPVEAIMRQVCVISQIISPPLSRIILGY